MAKPGKDQVIFTRMLRSYAMTQKCTRIFSSSHVSGEQLLQVSGVAAILRFPLPELEDMEEVEESLETTGKLIHFAVVLCCWLEPICL
jgi:hypothetical protein